MCLRCIESGRTSSGPQDLIVEFERLSAPASPPVSGGTAATPDPALEELGRQFLATYPSIDIHAHPGRFFMAGAGMRTELATASGGPFTEESIDDMRTGGVAAVAFAAVSDHLLLARGSGGLHAAREFDPGEAFEDYARQLDILAELVKSEVVVPALSADDIVRAHRQAHASCIVTVEGGDFLENRVERVSEAHQAGVRMITLVHYHTNQIGDIQTEAPVHGGLTALGRDIVGEMNRVGMLIDLSHASAKTAREVIEVSSRPLLFSHSNLRERETDHPRLIDVDLAKMVTDSGGLVGAVPAGFNLDTFDEYLDEIIRMVEILGADHVAIGTDMDYTYKPVISGYRDWPLIPAGLLTKGMDEADVAKVMGANFLRLIGDQSP